MKKLLFSTILILIVSLDWSNAQNVTFNETRPFDFIIDSCDGEKIEINGKVHFLVMDNGNFFTFHVNNNGKGIGLESGLEYSYNENAHVRIGDKNSTITTLIRLRGKGKAPNYLLKSIFHLTKNAKGDTVVDFSKADPLCN